VFDRSRLRLADYFADQDDRAVLAILMILQRGSRYTVSAHSFFVANAPQFLDFVPQGFHQPACLL